MAVMDIRRELEVLSGAPVSVLAIILACFVAGWVTASIVHRERMETLADQRDFWKSRAEGLQQFKPSPVPTGTPAKPPTTDAVPPPVAPPSKSTPSVSVGNSTNSIIAPSGGNNTINLAPQPRRLDPKASIAITDHLQGDKGRVVIFYRGDEPHGAEFANDFAVAFQAAGWEPMVYGGATFPTDGGIVAEAHQPAGLQAIKALNAAGIQVRPQRSQGMPFGQITALSLYLGDSEPKAPSSRVVRATIPPLILGGDP